MCGRKWRETPHNPVTYVSLQVKANTIWKICVLFQVMHHHIHWRRQQRRDFLEEHNDGRPTRRKSRHSSTKQKCLVFSRYISFFFRPEALGGYPNERSRRLFKKHAGNVIEREREREREFFSVSFRYGSRDTFFSGTMGRWEYSGKRSEGGRGPKFSSYFPFFFFFLLSRISAESLIAFSLSGMTREKQFSGLSIE